MTNEEMCLAGICCDCGGKMDTMTKEQIQTIKDDIGMGMEDDFCNVCDTCGLKYQPHN